MLRKSIIAMFCVLVLGPAWSASGDLVGWWTFDETEGTIAADSSGQGNNGTVVGAALWVPGKIEGALEFNGSTYVNCGNSTSLNIRDQVTIAFWFKVQAFVNEWEAFLSKGDGSYRASRSGGTGNATHMGITGSNYFDAPTTITDNQWHHYSATYDGATAIIYIDGKEDARQSYTGQIGDSSAYNLYLGNNSQNTTRLLHGLLDDVQIYNNALTPDEIQKIMEGLGNKFIAKDPNPEDLAVDVPQDAVLSWTAGEYAATHDVYIGDSFADVNEATTASADLLVSPGQPDTSYDSDGLFEFGKTYFWRVDEVNAAPDNTVFQGTVWRFTAEPFAYPIAGIKATASSSAKTTAPGKTVDGSGLTDGQHSTDLTHTWLSNNEMPCWIQYEFDRVCKLNEMAVWNSNQPMEGYIGWSAKDVAIEYSTDGTNWAALENVPQFTKAPGDATCTADTIDFGGILAKYVKLTITSNWGGIVKASGLSEVTFYQIPVQAREPQPADDATDVALDAQMNWRPGREATSHQVFFGTDSNAVADGLAPAGTVTDHRYTPASMEFGVKYFWKVDEIGEAGTYAGDVWSFTSQEFAPIDDFEDYDDSDNRIFDVWLDGYDDDTNGSIVGYVDSAGGTFGETSVIHGGKQSMPLAYDNTQSLYISETTREFATAQNWTGSGATELCVWTRGRPVLTATPVAVTGGKLSLTGAGSDIWGTSDEFTYAFKTLSGDGSLVARVASRGTGTNEWTKGGAMIRDALRGGSTHAFMPITGGGGNGASFQNRPVADLASASVDSGSAITPPYWVKIERTGDSFTGSVSADGKTWSVVGTTIIVMEAPVYIGLAVTSHVATEQRTFEFDGIATTGTVTGDWQRAVIDAPIYNDAADMYLTVTDSTGKSATAISSTAAVAVDWTAWKIPMDSFAGVNFAKVKKLVIGVGTKGATTAGGIGMVFVDDIGYGRSAQ